MHFVHASADIQSVIFGTIRSAFEYNGQKCSACSRMYVPQSIWPAVRDGMLKVLKEIKMGSPLNKECFVTAVIDAKVGFQFFSLCNKKFIKFIFFYLSFLPLLFF